jgi:hypothetical protein
MAHLNVKPLERSRVYVEPEHAITHVLVHQVWSKAWDFGGQSFGQTITARRAIDAAIKANSSDAFVAHKRRGYWRVELRQ